MTEDEQPRKRQREAFGRALVEALSGAGLSRKELSEQLSVALSTLSEWITGESEPAKPAVTFELERILGTRPGELSGHLGYVPSSAAGTLEAALLGSAEVDDNLRRVLLALVREIERQRDR